jgi:phosphoglycolate phosphatase
MKPAINLLISDLDNTMYDWTAGFVPSFYAMVGEALTVESLKADRERLLDDLRAVHQRYGSSEHPYALLETDTVRRAYPAMSFAERKKLLRRAFEAFSDARRRHLRLYPTVLATLRQVRRAGCPVVAYTEARVESAAAKLDVLNLWPEIDALYAPEGNGNLDSRMELSRHGAPLHKISMLADTHRKPDPDALRSICNDFRIEPSCALYIGDSLLKDISMANSAGLRSAWAEYGAKVDDRLWKELVRVTHWTPEQVAENERLRASCVNATPSVRVESFGELLKHFHFAGAQVPV